MSSNSLTAYVSMRGNAYRDNLLCEAIAEGPIDREDLVDKHKLSRRSIKAVQIGISLCANGSYFPIILHAGVPLAVGNGVSFITLDYWAVNATLDDALGPRSAREIELIARNSHGACYKASLTAGALGLALLAVAPIALPTLDYDGKYGVLGLAAVLLGGSILPLRSIQLSLNKTIQEMKCVLGESGQKIEAIRAEMIALVYEYKSVFEQMGLDEKLKLISDHNAIREMAEQDKVGKYISTVLGGVKKFESEVDPTRTRKIISLAGQVVENLPGAFLTATYETALAMYTFSKAHEYITDNDAGAGIFTAVTIGCGVYLNGKSIVATTHRFACAIFNGLRCKRTKGISEQLRPKLAACLKLIGLTLNIGTIGSALVIFGDFFKDDEAKRNYFEVTMSIAYFLLTATATLDLVDDAIKAIVLQKGSGDEKEVILLCEELVHFKRLLEKSSLLDFSLFILKCPNEVKAGLLKRVNLSFDALTEHIEKLEGSESKSILDVELATGSL